jgi:hypothetical protein
VVEKDGRWTTEDERMNATFASYQSTSKWFAAARAVCAVFFIYATLIFLIAIPARWTQLTQPTSITLANLSGLGWSVAPYAIYSLATEVIFAGVYLLIALIIFVRRSNDGGALVTAVFLVAFGFGNQTITPTLNALSVYPFGTFAFQFGGFAGWVTLPLFFYLFPNGRFVPAWTRVTTLIWFLVCIPWNFMVDTPFYPLNWHPALFVPLLISMYGTFISSPIYRYVRVSNTLERQQTKWVIYSFVMMVSIELVIIFVATLLSTFAVIGYLNPAIGEAPTPEIFAILVFLQSGLRLIWLILPLALAFSILRYRLWDIDIIIRRTLIYSILTALLALFYFGAVIVLQQLFRALTGAGDDLAIIVSTLALAALFNPLRHRVQDAIDHRFYRRKYDAHQVLERFAATARDEVELEKLTGELLHVVNETMQPMHASLWLKSREREK